MRLGKHFRLEEFTISRTAVRSGIRNVPEADDVARIAFLVLTGLQVWRDALSSFLGREEPFIITSGFRSPGLNAAVRGEEDSGHLLGLAADFTTPRVLRGSLSLSDALDCFLKVSDAFDQVIIYPGEFRFHLGVKIFGGRSEVLMEKAPGKYEVWP